MHRRAIKHKRLVMIEMTIKKYKRYKKYKEPFNIAYKGEYEWVWGEVATPAYLPSFPVDSKEFRKIEKEIR